MNKPTQEQWRPVVGYEGLYEVSNCGNVRSLDRRILRSDGLHMRVPGRNLKQTRNGPGYCRVILSKVGTKPKTVWVHRLVLESFVGPCPEGMEACHNDSDPSNNSLENLRWDTHAANMQDKVENWTVCKNGHPITPDNLYTRPGGRRQCRKCRNEDKKRYNHRNYKPKPPKQRPTHCANGHPLEAPNLSEYRLKKGIYTCLACERARVYVRRHPEFKPNFKEVSDSYYSDISK